MAIKNIIEREIATGFASFEGMTISGSVPVRAPLVNEIIAAVLQNDAADSPTSVQTGDARASVPEAAKRASPSLSDLKRMVSSANVRFVEGAMICDFEIRR